MLQLRPHITEKSMALASRGWYTFVTDVVHSKGEIAKTIEKLFNVSVTDIKTATFKGKTKRTGRKRIETKGRQWKKAVVSLKKGEKIDAFEFSETQK